MTGFTRMLLFSFSSFYHLIAWLFFSRFHITELIVMVLTSEQFSPDVIKFEGF